MTRFYREVAKITSGDTLYFDVAVTNPDGRPVDLTGVSVIWALGRAPSGPALITKTTADNSVVILSEPGGLLRVKVEPADTADLNGFYHHEAQATDATGNVTTIFQGRIEVVEDLI